MWIIVRLASKIIPAISAMLATILPQMENVLKEPKPTALTTVSTATKLQAGATSVLMVTMFKVENVP